MQAVHKCFHRAGKQETNNTSSFLNHGQCNSNSVRTVSFAYSGKVEKNFRLNKPYISVSMEQEKNRQRSCFHAISNYLGIRLENAAIARSGKL